MKIYNRPDFEMKYYPNSDVILSSNPNETEIIPFGSGVFGDENELDWL